MFADNITISIPIKDPEIAFIKLNSITKNLNMWRIDINWPKT